MWARDAHEGTRIRFRCDIDGGEHTALVGPTVSQYVDGKRRWFVTVTLDQPNELTGPGVALSEEHIVAPLDGQLPNKATA